MTLDEATIALGRLMKDKILTIRTTVNRRIYNYTDDDVPVVSETKTHDVIVRERYTQGASEVSLCKLYLNEKEEIAEFVANDKTTYKEGSRIVKAIGLFI